jgi:hypothetical protein
MVRLWRTLEKITKISNNQYCFVTQHEAQFGFGACSLHLHCLLKLVIFIYATPLSWHCWDKLSERKKEWRCACSRGAVRRGTAAFVLDAGGDAAVCSGSVSPTYDAMYFVSVLCTMYVVLCWIYVGFQKKKIYILAPKFILKYSTY